ncbi:MAG: DUF983 domain-containing protein [Sphingobacteriales bacterium]|nr:MAG: DUF983 domain-containing protein [Sphingobacteriales bacterium]TAF78570.1 MAG: DUF983 domain-containing protein [Sphingobacteriales bacterium]
MPTSLSYAMLHAKCPRCRQGKLFETPMYGYKAQKMYENCPKCNFKYEIEPGYFYAAMYVGYAFNVAMAVAIGILTYLVTLEEHSPWIYVANILIASILASPLNFRYSRVILLYWLSPKIKYVAHYDHN